MRNGVYWRISDKNAIALAEFIVRKNAQSAKAKYEALNANDSFKQLIFDYYPNIDFSDAVKTEDFYHILHMAFKHADEDNEMYVSLNKSKKKHKMYSFLSQDGRLYLNIDIKPKKPEGRVEKPQKSSLGDHFELIFDNMLSGCAIFSFKNKGERAQDYILEEINKTGREIEGSLNEQLIGKSLDQIRVNIDKTVIMDEIKKVAITGQTSSTGIYLYNLDGYNNYYETVMFRLSPHKIAIMFNDVTEAVNTQKETEKSKRRLASYIENSPYGIFIAEMSGEILDVNREMMKMGGYLQKEWVGHNVLDYIAKEDFARAQKDLTKVRRDKESFAAVYKCLNKDGHIRHWHINTVKLENEGFIGFVNDITIRHELESQLRASEYEYRALFDHAGLAIEYYDTNGRIIWMNKAAAAAMGSTPEHFTGKSVYEVFPKGKAEVVIKRKNEAIAGCKIIKYEDHIKTNSADRYILSTYNCIEGQDGMLLGVEVIYVDITELRASQKALSESQERYSAMIENISDVITVVGSDGEILYMSPNVLMWFGWDRDDLKGKNAMELVHPDEKDSVGASMAAIIDESYSVKNIKLRCRCKDGTYKHISVTARNMMHDKSIGGILINFHDITDRVNLEKEKLKMDSYMRTRQKLDSVGTLASGVAHEINNPVNGIINYSQVILDGLDDKEHIEKCAQEIMHEAGRVSDIVKNLLDFSRPQKQNFERRNIKEILDRTLSLLKTTLRHDKISLELDIPEGLPDISCLSGQIQQVLMNLITNARDSLNSKYHHGHKNKKLTIKAQLTHEDGCEAIRVTIQDNGMGIPEEVTERIFDPFFTTKSRDKGTGLGLSISYGIVKEHNGNLTFDTQPGEYTKFYLDLPILKEK